MAWYAIAIEDNREVGRSGHEKAVGGRELLRGQAEAGAPARHGDGEGDAAADGLHGRAAGMTRIPDPTRHAHR